MVDTAGDSAPSPALSNMVDIKKITALIPLSCWNTIREKQINIAFFAALVWQAWKNDV